jgi:LEA14-like dessication related protein
METIKKSKVRVPVKTNPRAIPIAKLTDDVPPIGSAVKLESFSVTHNSVVATMNFVVKKEHTRIKIWWGDETQNQQPETIFIRSFGSIQQPILGGEVLPENTYKLQHAYDENAPKRKIILVQVQDIKDRITWETAVIEIEPRYTFISYPVIIKGKEHLDTFLESNSEFTIDMVVTLNNGTLLEKHWELSIKTDDTPFSFKLKESGYKTEIIYSDEPINIKFLISEDDNIFKSVGNSILDFITNPGVEFDTSNQINRFSFHPRHDKGNIQTITSYKFDDDGSVDVVFNLEMNLIVPLAKVNQPVSARS